MKACSKCGIEKPLEQYAKNKQTPDGLRRECKPCRKIYVAQWRLANLDRCRAVDAARRAANPEKVKAYTAKWNAANPEKLRAKRDAWRQANPGKFKARSARWHLANKEAVNARSAEWRKANPEASRAHRRNRRARKLEVGGTLSSGLAAKLYGLQKGRCACCREPLGDDYHLDHILPLTRGGTNTDDNIQLLRATCNLQKHAKHPIDYMQSKGFLL
jgi:hypothetical protein